MRICDWSSYLCSSDLAAGGSGDQHRAIANVEKAIRRHEKVRLYRFHGRRRRIYTLTEFDSDNDTKKLKKRNEQVNDITVGTIGEPRRGVIRKSNGASYIRPEKEGGAIVGIQKTGARKSTSRNSSH